jgi:hypothetical protein
MCHSGRWARTTQRSKFTEAQIAFILRQVEEGTAAGEVCRNKSVVATGAGRQ